MTIINSIIKILNDVMVETVIEIFKNDSDPQIKSNNKSNVTKINKRDADIAPFLIPPGSQILFWPPGSQVSFAMLLRICADMVEESE